MIQQALHIPQLTSMHLSKHVYMLCPLHYQQNHSAGCRDSQNSPCTVTAPNHVFGACRDSQNRTMPKFLWTSSSAMSTELCAHIALAEGWPAFGLQYGMEVRPDCSTAGIMQALQPLAAAARGCCSCSLSFEHSLVYSGDHGGGLPVELLQWRHNRMSRPQQSAIPNRESLNMGTYAAAKARVAVQQGQPGCCSCRGVDAIHAVRATSRHAQAAASQLGRLPYACHGMPTSARCSEKCEACMPDMLWVRRLHDIADEASARLWHCSAVHMVTI
jgi:hypothetical protein